MTVNGLVQHPVVAAAALRARTTPASVAQDVLCVGVSVLVGCGVMNASLAVRWQISVVALAVWVVLQLRRNTIRRADVTFGTLALLTLTSLRWTTDLVSTQGAIVTQLSALVVFLLVRAVITHLRSLILICCGYLGGCLLAANAVREHLSRLAFAPASLGYYESPDLTGLNPNYLAYAMATGLTLGIIVFTFRDRPNAFESQVALGVVCVIMVWGVQATAARGALVGLLLLTLWLLFYRLHPRALFRALLIGFVVASVAIATGLANLLVTRVVSPSARDTGDLNGRLPLWHLARIEFANHPIIGLGAGAFRDANPQGLVAHNGFLEVATGLGGLGVVLLVVSLYLSLITETRGLRDPLRYKVVGAFIAVSAPCFLSGNWVQAPALWSAIAIVSRLPVVYGSSSGGRGGAAAAV